MADGETTKDLQKKYDTKPTIETVLKRINALEQSLNARMDQRFDEVYQRLDKIDAMAHLTRADMLNMRAEFNEFKAEFKDFRSHFGEPA